MNMVRLHVPQSLPSKGIVVLNDNAFHHLCRVLRAKVGQRVVLFNGDGADYIGTLIAISKRDAQVEIREKKQNCTTPRLPITLLQSISKGERMDWALQKSVELGVHHIVPVITERTVVRLSPDRWEKKHQHWQQVVISACEQCGRSEVPAITPVQTLTDAWCRLPSQVLRLAAIPMSSTRISELDSNSVRQGVAILVGPEGGLSESEVNALSPLPINISLGPRVLRTETAPLVILTALQVLFGDI